MRKKSLKACLKLCLPLLLLFTVAHAQTKIFIGKVTDSLGQGIPGASVKIKGENKGAITNNDGSFQLKVSGGETLVIQALNYAGSEYNIGSTLDGTIVLKNSSGDMGEVVVTALGIRRNRNTLPYAAQQISGDDMNRTAATLNPVSNLSGKVAGLQITQAATMGGSTNVILRGFKSLTQSNQALFVVDGVPYDNSNQSRNNYDLGNTGADLNPDDIASVSVLKGAAASALYGSRASNGVIMITTKKGSGRKTLGVAVSFGVTVGTPDNSTLPTYQTQYGQGIGGNGEVGPFGFADTSGFFYHQPTLFSNGVPVNIVQTNNDAGTGPAYNPSLMVYNWDAFTPGDANYGKATPWTIAKHYKPQDYFVTPITSQVNIAVNQSFDQGMFRLGFTHDDNKGLYA